MNHSFMCDMSLVASVQMPHMIICTHIYTHLPDQTPPPAKMVYISQAKVATGSETLDNKTMCDMGWGMCDHKFAKVIRWSPKK